MLTFRFATREDVDMYFNWTNDPEVRNNSYNSSIVDYSAHVSWFNKRIDAPDCFMYLFLNEEGVPVGQVRIEKDSSGEERTSVISISTDKQFRGRGHGTEMLQLASDDFLSGNPGHRIVAYIFEVNKASAKSFKNAGYVLTEQKEVKGIPSFIMEKKSHAEH
jgi:RimJ/RimL family protein N-acetyltransferase